MLEPLLYAGILWDRVFPQVPSFDRPYVDWRNALTPYAQHQREAHEEARLLAAAPTEYRPRLPLGNVLAYASAFEDQDSNPTRARNAWVMQIQNGAAVARRRRV